MAQHGFGMIAGGGGFDHPGLAPCRQPGQQNRRFDLRRCMRACVINSHRAGQPAHGQGQIGAVTGGAGGPHFNQRVGNPGHGPHRQ